MDIKKIAILAVLLAAVGAVGYGFWSRNLRAKETTVSGLTGKPADFLGNVVVSGLAGRAFPDKGAFELKDEKGCCAIFIFVPSSEEQKKEFRVPYLYKGQLPGTGQPVKVSAKVVQNDQGFVLEVKDVESGGNTIITRI
jgi:hypothetical protein